MNIQQQKKWIEDEVLTHEVQSEVFGALRKVFEVLQPLNERIENKMKWSKENVQDGEKVSDRALLLALTECMTKTHDEACDDIMNRVMAQALATGEGLW